MKNTQKKFLSAVLAASSVAGVVAPAVTAFAATATEVETLVASALKDKTFYSFNVAYGAILSLPAADQGKYLGQIAPLEATVKTPEIVNILKEIDKFYAVGQSTEGDMSIYDNVLYKLIPAIPAQIDREYLQGELGKWGMKFITEKQPEYIAATDAIIAVNNALAAGKIAEAQALVPAAEAAIAKVVNANNKTYLTTVTLPEVVGRLNAATPVSIASVTAVTSKRVDVKLSAAVSAVDKSKFTITSAAGTALSVDAATVSADGKTVSLTTAAQTPGVLYTVTAENVSKTFVGLVADTTIPVIKTVSAVNNKLVQVNFSAKDGSPAILDPANYSIPGLTISEVKYVVDADGTVNKDKVYLVTSAQTGGSVYTLTATNVTDLSGNKIDGSLTFSFAGKAADSSAPTLTSVTSSKGNTVTVKLNDASQLDENTLLADNFSISGLTISTVSVTKNLVNDSEKIVKLTTTTQEVGKVYTLTVKGVKDVFGNTPSSNLTQDFAGTVVDTTPANLQLVNATTNTTVTVTFDDVMDEATAENVANYTVNNGLTVTNAVLDTDSTSSTYLKKVTLTTSAQTAGTVYRLTVANVKDAAGNAITTTQTYYMDFAGKTADATKPTAAITALAGSQVKVVFTDASDMDEDSVKTLSNYVFDGGLGFPTAVSYDKATKTATLTTATQTNGTVYNVTINGVKDVAGNVIATDTKLSFAGIGSSLDAPALSSVVALNSRQIQVAFNKDMTSGSVAIGDFTLAKGSAAAASLPGTSTVYKVDNKTYIVTLPVGSELTADVYKLAITGSVTDLGYVALDTTDSAKATKTFGGTDTAATTPKALTATQTSLNQLQVVFENQVALSAFTAVSDVTVSYDSTTINLASTTSYSVDSTKKIVTFTFASAIAKDKVAKLTIGSTNGFSSIKDVTGNIVMVKNDDSTGNFIKTFGTNDFTTSTLKVSSAVGIDENTVEVTFNQDIVFTDVTSNPAAGASALITRNDGTVIVDGTDYDVTNVRKTASNKIKVYLSPVTTKMVEGQLYTIDFANIGATVTALNGGAALSGTSSSDTKATFGYNATVNEAPYLVSVTPLSADTLQLNFSESLNANPVIGTDLKFYIGSTSGTEISANIGSVTDISSKKTFTVKLTGGVFAAGTTYAVQTLSGLKDKYLTDGVKVTDGTNVKAITFGGVGTATPLASADVTYVEVAGATNDTITINSTTTTKALVAGEVLTFKAGSNVLTYTITAGDVLSLAANTALTITVTDAGLDTALTGVAGGEVTVTVTDTANNVSAGFAKF